MDPLCVLIGAALVCLVVGSVIYTLVSLLGGGRRRREIAFLGGDCPLCATSVPLESTTCPECGFPLNEARYPTLANDFEATKRQLNRLASSGLFISVALIMTLIFELDEPRTGLIRVPQTPMERVASAILSAPPPN